MAAPKRALASLRPYLDLTPLAGSPRWGPPSSADQFYAGKAAAVTRKLGKGSITYIGVDTLDGELERALLHGVYQDAGAAPANLAPNFLVDWRDGFWVATNFASKTEGIPAPPNARILTGAREVPPGGVAVWQEP